MLRHKLASACGAAIFLLMSTGPITHAQQNGTSQNGTTQNGTKQNGPTISATPELDSGVLFLVGAGGGTLSYLVLRRRARRRQD